MADLHQTAVIALTIAWVLLLTVIWTMPAEFGYSYWYWIPRKMD